MLPESLSDRRDARTYARAMLLAGGPISSMADSLILTIINTIIVPFREGTVQRRPTMLIRYGQALGPFLSELLHSAKAGRWSKLRSNNKDLATYPGRATAFATLRASMGAAGLLEELPGFFREEDRFGVNYQQAAMTSFRATPKLFQMAEGHGVTQRNLAAHFTMGKVPAPAPFDIVEARAAKASNADRAEPLPIAPDDPKALALIADMERLNAYLMEDGRIEGIAFAGLRRIFSNGDQPGFAWQWGGRFYSMSRGDAYESMTDGGEDGAGRRARANVLRIDGEEVEEVDLSASHLTILHGLLGIPFDASQASYDFPDLERGMVKEWIMRALGASNPEGGGPKYARVRRAVHERFPVLSGLGANGITTYDLQFHEAEIMMIAMADLMDRGIGFLPVHDALSVPASQRDLAATVLTEAFRRYFVETLGMANAPMPRVH